MKAVKIQLSMLVFFYQRHKRSFVMDYWILLSTRLNRSLSLCSDYLPVIKPEILNVFV